MIFINFSQCKNYCMAACRPVLKLESCRKLIVQRIQLIDMTSWDNNFLRVHRVSVDVDGLLDLGFFSKKSNPLARKDTCSTYQGRDI